MEYICENTPWFLGGVATCIIDLPNIEQIATGSYKRRIELWDLSTENNKIEMENEDRGTAQLAASKDKKSKKKKGGVAKQNVDEIILTDEPAKTPK